MVCHSCHCIRVSGPDFLRSYIAGAKWRVSLNRLHVFLATGVKVVENAIILKFFFPLSLHWWFSPWNTGESSTWANWNDGIGNVSGNQTNIWLSFSKIEASVHFSIIWSKVVGHAWDVRNWRPSGITRTTLSDTYFAVLLWFTYLPYPKMCHS